MIDVIEGRVTNEDKERMKDALLKITKGSTRLYDMATPVGWNSNVCMIIKYIFSEWI